MRFTRSIAEYLTERGVCDFRTPDDPDPTGGDTFVTEMPDDTASGIAHLILATGGTPADGKLGYDHPAFQVVTRARDPDTSYDRLLAIYSELHGLEAIALPGGTWLVSCFGIQSEPVDLGQDPNGDFRHSLNYECEIRALTANRE